MGGSQSKRIRRAASGNIRLLKFDGVNLGPRGLAQIAEAMDDPNCRVVRICIYNEHIGPASARTLAKLIGHPNKPLLSLILENNILASEGAIILANALKVEGNRLHVLYLLSNHIGQEGIKALCDGLKHPNNHIAELSLTGNYLGMESLSELGDVIRHPNNRLQYLRLGRNRIDNRGACILARAIVTPASKLRSLDLENNMLTDCRDLTKSMKLSRLQWVDVSYNHDNPYDQTKMFCDVRAVFFEKRRFWRSILALCSAREAPSILTRFLLQLEELSLAPSSSSLAKFNVSGKKSTATGKGKSYRYSGSKHQQESEHDDDVFHQHHPRSPSSPSSTERRLLSASGLTDVHPPPRHHSREVTDPDHSDYQQQQDDIDATSMKQSGASERSFSARIKSTKRFLSLPSSKVAASSRHQQDSASTATNINNGKSMFVTLVSPRPAAHVNPKDMCWLCLLPKDIIRQVAEAAYPWHRNDKTILDFVYG